MSDAIPKTTPGCTCGFGGFHDDANTDCLAYAGKTLEGNPIGPYYPDLLMVRRTFSVTDFDTGPGEAVNRLHEAAEESVVLRKKFDEAMAVIERQETAAPYGPKWNDLANDNDRLRAECEYHRSRADGQENRIRLVARGEQTFHETWPDLPTPPVEAELAEAREALQRIADLDDADALAFAYGRGGLQAALEFLAGVAGRALGRHVP